MWERWLWIIVRVSASAGSLTVTSMAPAVRKEPKVVGGSSVIEAHDMITPLIRVGGPASVLGGGPRRDREGQESKHDQDYPGARSHDGISFLNVA